jgi:hypothetical protein
MELATVLNTAKSGGLIMAAIAQVFTISYVANLLGEDEDWLFELSTDMFPEDGCLWVYSVGEDGVPAFTKDGIENLRQIIADERSAGRAPPQVKSAKSPSLRCSPHAYAYRSLADPKRAGRPATLAFCWAHWRRQWFDLAKSPPAPIATEALKRIAELYQIEAEIRGKRRRAPGGATGYAFNRWDGLLRFLEPVTWRSWTIPGCQAMQRSHWPPSLTTVVPAATPAHRRLVSPARNPRTTWRRACSGRPSSDVSIATMKGVCPRRPRPDPSPERSPTT